MNITVYLGAFPGNDPSFELAVKELGTWIGKSHNALIYGGSKSGLMGLIAESTLLAGGEVIGVEKSENDRTWGCFYCISRWNRNIGRNCRDHFKGILKTA